jgi:hypothetical protein
MVKKKSKQEFQGGKKIISHINTASVAQGEVKSMDKKEEFIKRLSPRHSCIFLCVSKYVHSLSYD